MLQGTINLTPKERDAGPACRYVCNVVNIDMNITYSTWYKSLILFNPNDLNFVIVTFLRGFVPIDQDIF